MVILLTLWAVYAQGLGKWMRARTEARELVIWGACVYPGRERDPENIADHFTVTDEDGKSIEVNACET